MAEIVFKFGNIKEAIKCNTNEKMIDIFKRIAIKIDKDINQLSFVYGGIILNHQNQKYFYK